VNYCRKGDKSHKLAKTARMKWEVRMWLIVDILVADQLRAYTKALESTEADNKKGFSSELDTNPAKKRHHFLCWRGVLS